MMKVSTPIVSNIYSKAYSNNKTVTSDRATNQDNVAFTGTKTTIVGAAAAGIAVSYYAVMAMFAPPVIKQHVNNEYVRTYEYKVASTFIDQSDNPDEELIVINEAIELAKKYPEESITKGCLDVLSRYDIVNKYDNGELTKTIKELAEDKTLDKNSKKFYIEYLENLNSSSD